MLRVLATGLLLMASSFAAAEPASEVEARRKAFSDLLAEHWEYTLSRSPEFASILGDKRWNDKVSDVSEKAILEDLARTKEFLGRFEAVDTAGFPEQEALTRTLLVRRFKEGLGNAHFKNWEMPVSQVAGIHLQAPQLVALLSFVTVKDYDDYVARLKQFPKQMDDTIDLMKKGMADNLMQPKFLLDKVVTQAEGIASQKPEDTPFARPLASVPKDFSEEDRTRLR